MNNTMLLTWHDMNDMPESYDVEYSHKCNEYSKGVFIALEDGNIIRGIRRRLITEENFQWVNKMNEGKPIIFRKTPKLWCFVPNKLSVKEFIKYYG